MMGVVSKPFAATVRMILAICLAGGSALSAAPRPRAEASPSLPSFHNEVMAVLSKAGCNSGPCHGNQNGKAGFKLSLRGEDPERDFQALTRDMFARRTNPAEPDQSLLLLKATAQLGHEGGQRFRRDSAEYAMLRNWIADGMPEDPPSTPKLVRLDVSPATKILVEPAKEIALDVKAVFSDGTRRDVRRLAVYEPANRVVTVSPEGLVRRERLGEETVLVRYLDQQAPVRLAFIPRRAGFKWANPPANNFIDEHIFARLRELRMNPSALCTDTEFLRRASLDLIGLLPTVAEARAFAADMRSDKRARLVDALLTRPEHADFWALKWADVLRNEEKVLDAKGIKAFQDWLRRSVAENKPVDQFARALVAGRGSTYTNPPANYYRALREPTARSEATAQLFLGTRLGCARCHNHPFDRWTQQDYYDWADVFAKVSYRIVENKKRDNLDSHEFVGEQFVLEGGDAQVKNPRTGKAAQARLLGTPSPLQAQSAMTNRLDALADWLTHPDNPLFARAQVNRVWFHLMGRGLVDPVDDFRATNPASHPALLDALAADFTGHGFNLRRLIALIVNSRAYQLSPEPNDTNRDDETHYARAMPRRLTAEQLLDAQHQVLDRPAEFEGHPVGLRAAQLAGGSPVRRVEVRAGGPEKLLAQFGKPARLLACECERSNETTLNQAFQLISGPALHALVSHPDNRLGALLAAGTPSRAIVEELYWNALTRAPSDAELTRATTLLDGASDRRQALEDLAWALLNAKEFVLRK
jgi:hypothetical protein